eukprot:3029917-Karenia_brevis.AAC.1
MTTPTVPARLIFRINSTWLRKAGVRYKSAWLLAGNASKFYMYGGFDCTHKWAVHLGDPERVGCLAARLSEALGLTEKEVDLGHAKISTGEWSRAQVASALEHYILGSILSPASLASLFLEPDVQQSDGSNPVLDHLRG